MGAARILNGVTAVAIRPDARLLATALSDGRVLVRHLPMPEVDEVEQMRLRYQVWTNMELRDGAICQPLAPEA
jgi:hypothetical protein